MAVIFYFPRPKSHFRTGKYSTHLKETAPDMHITKPDASNLLKFVEDALQQCKKWDGFYKDDSQIVEVKAEKYYVSQGEQARTEVMIDEI